MVGHGDRQLILREVCRVLASDGAFVFSTYNRQSNDFSAGLVWPELKLVRNPLRSAWRVLQVAQAAVKSISNRRRNRRFEQHENEYAVINDRCHNYATMLYYIDIAQQRRQLAEAGFAPTAEVFDMQGRPGGDDAKDSSICFIARKQAHRA
jgi:hypothetical protein